MKQSAAKTLGVAALGAAFAAAAAGTASAAHAVPDLTAAPGNLSTTLPLDEVTEKLPAGAAAAPATVQDAAAAAPATVQDAVERAVPSTATDPVSGLLGGLPVTGGGPLGSLPGGLSIGA
jgi:outer membrane receptor protein involved in Fe transport